MQIYNQGKYRSLHAAGENELRDLAAIVAQDQDFRPRFHLAPPTGLFNDPNGLIFDGEQFHLFFQWYPFGALHGMKHWKHYTTHDFRQFCEADPLIPDEPFESHGCYSGGAILWQDQIVAFYTGNTRRASDNARVPHQNLAIFSKSGKLLSKRNLLDCAPAGYTEHVRDPKPFVHNGKIYLVLGAQRENGTGTALLYEMDSPESEARLLGEIRVTNVNNDGVFMWECPDLSQLGGRDLFIWSPQGKAQEACRFQNNYHAMYALGAYRDLCFETEQQNELDQGFDFYAPQTVANWGAGERALMLAWIGLPDLTYPTDRFEWHSMASLPRELMLRGGCVVQQPARYLDALKCHAQTERFTLEGAKCVESLDQCVLEIAVNAPFELQLFENAAGEQLRLRFADGKLCLDRSRSEQTDLMKSWGEVRYCAAPQCEKLTIFIDHSVIEIFVNDGEQAMSSRFFISARENWLKSDTPLVMTLTPMQAISIVTAS